MTRLAFLIGFLFLLVLLPTRLLFAHSFPYTHDGENHLARFANYKIALREGQFPPRFAPNLVNHYGYPVFNFNYPLANILSVPLSLAGFSYQQSFKVLATASVLLGALGAWQWLRTLQISKMGRAIALGGYLVSPYLLSAIVFRGSIGEVMALGLVPWIFYGIEQSRDEMTVSKLLFFSCITAAFLLAHNTTVLLVVPILMLYSFVRTGGVFKQLQTILLWFGVAVSMTLWFWLPALVEKNLVILDAAALSVGFSDHFVTAAQLLTMPLRFGFSYVGSVDSLSFSVGLFQIVVLGLGLLVSIVYFFTKRNYTWLTLCLLSFVLLILQHRLTLSIWQVTPLVRFIQFPWRLTLLIIVLALPLAGWVYDKVNAPLKALLVVVLVFQALVTLGVELGATIDRPNIEYDLFSQSTTTLHENTPKTFLYSDISDWSPEPRVVYGEAEFNVKTWTGSYRRYDVVAHKPSLIAEPTMFFPGWRTLITTDSTSRLVSEAEQLDLEGRVGYELDTGSYQITSRFTQWTWPRLLGNTVSMLVAVVVVFLFGKHFWQEQKGKL